MANLRLIDDLGLVRNAGETGAYLTQAMRDALGEHPNVGEIRGAGMLAAVELVEDRDARRFFDPARKVGIQIAAAMLADSGVIARAMPQGDILGFAPPLCTGTAVPCGARKPAIPSLLAGPAAGPEQPHSAARGHAALSDPPADSRCRPR